MSMAYLKGGATPATVSGILKKKCPKFPVFQQRYVVVRDSRLEWYGSEKEFKTFGEHAEDESYARGFVHLQATKCSVQPEGSTGFSVGPEEGDWQGEPVTNKFTGRTDRIFYFDAASSTWDRDHWIYNIKLHMKPAGSAEEDEDDCDSDGFASCMSESDSENTDVPSFNTQRSQLTIWMTERGYVPEASHKAITSSTSSKPEMQAKVGRLSEGLTAFDGDVAAAFKNIPGGTHKWPELTLTCVRDLSESNGSMICDEANFFPSGSVEDIGLLFSKLFDPQSNFTKLFHELRGHQVIEWNPPVPLEAASWTALSTLECRVQLPVLGQQSCHEVHRFALCRENSCLVLAMNTCAVIMAGAFGTFRLDTLSTFTQQTTSGPVRMRTVWLGTCEDPMLKQQVVSAHQARMDDFCAAARFLPLGRMSRQLSFSKKNSRC